MLLPIFNAETLVRQAFARDQIRLASHLHISESQLVTGSTCETQIDSPPGQPFHLVVLS